MLNPPLMFILTVFPLASWTCRSARASIVASLVDSAGAEADMLGRQTLLLSPVMWVELSKVMVTGVLAGELGPDVVFVPELGNSIAGDDGAGIEALDGL